MMAFLTWLAGTRAGRIVAACGAGALALGIAFLRVFGAGKAAERSKQDKVALEAQRTRSRIDDETTKLADDDARRELDRWVRGNGEKHL